MLGFPIKMDIVAIVSLLLVNIVHLPRFPCTWVDILQSYSQKRRSYGPRAPD